jgi:hypothetical protein
LCPLCTAGIGLTGCLAIGTPLPGKRLFVVAADLGFSDPALFDDVGVLSDAAR